MEFLNKALFAKLGWSILTNFDSLWVHSMKVKYLRGADLFSVSAHPSSSCLQKKILKNRDIISKNIISKNACQVISPASTLNIWNTPWLPNMPGFKPIPNPLLHLLLDFSFANLFLPESRTWNVDLLLDLFTLATIQAIRTIYIPISLYPNHRVWVSSSLGTFSVKATHESLISSSAPYISPFNPLDWTKLWSLKIQHRLKHLL